MRQTVLELLVQEQFLIYSRTIKVSNNQEQFLNFILRTIQEQFLIYSRTVLSLKQSRTVLELYSKNNSRTVLEHSLKVTTATYQYQNFI